MQSSAQAAPTQSGGNPAVLLGLVGVVAGGVLLAKQTQPQSNSKSSSGGGRGPSASGGGQAPQSAGTHAHTFCWAASLGLSTEHLSLMHVSCMNMYPHPLVGVKVSSSKQSPVQWTSSIEAALHVAGHSSCALRFHVCKLNIDLICCTECTFCAAGPLCKTLLAT